MSVVDVDFGQSPLRRIWHLMGPERGQMVWGMVFRMGQSISLGVAYATILWVIRGFLSNRSVTSELIWLVSGLMLASLAGQLLFSFLSVRLSWQASYRICSRLRIGILEHLQALPMGFHLSRQKGDLANVLSTDINMIEAFLSDSVARIVQAFGLPVSIFVFILFQDWRLALAMAATIIAGLPIMVLTGRHLAKVGLIRQDSQAETASQIIEYVQGIKIIRAFGQMASGNVRFDRALTQFRDLSIGMVRELIWPIMTFIAVVMLGLPITLVAIGLTLDSLTPTIAITALVLAFSMYSPIIALVSVTELVRMAEASLMRIDRVLSQPTLLQPSHPQTPQGYGVTLNEVSFGYEPNRLAVEGLSLDVPERSMTAIVGPSGSGKSTILNLIARFWDVDTGTVSIGGVALGALDTTTLMAQISFVFQDVYLFNGSIRDNIAIGRKDATKGEIIAAAKSAQAHTFITALPQGYDSDAGEGGARLSGGERQRIAIARAILKDAPIILLDEATSAIDPINERALQIALSHLVADRTLIVVAHKVATIEAADQILVLEAGRIVERGTHHSLLAENGLYHRLFTKKQQAEGWVLSSKTRKKTLQ